jgi:hypothetical protein
MQSLAEKIEQPAATGALRCTPGDAGAASWPFTAGLTNVAKSPIMLVSS